VPSTLTVGSTLLGRLVTNISGTTITLGGNSSLTISSPTNVDYFSTTAQNLASASGNITIAGAGVTIGGFGDITLTGSITDTSSTNYGFTKIGIDTLTLSGSSTGDLFGPVLVNSGILKLGSNTALGSSVATIFSGGVLDLNGTSTTNNIVVNGAGFNNVYAVQNTLGGHYQFIRLHGDHRRHADTGFGFEHRFQCHQWAEPGYHRRQHHHQRQPGGNHGPLQGGQ